MLVRPDRVWHVEEVRMARGTRWSAVLLAGLALALAGCTHRTPTTPPGATGAPSAPTSGSGASRPPVSPAITAGYPGDANGYSRAAVAAWVAGDQGRLDQLRASANQVFQTLSAGNYDKHFGLYQCTGAAGSSVC